MDGSIAPRTVFIFTDMGWVITGIFSCLMKDSPVTGILLQFLRMSKRLVVLVK